MVDLLALISASIAPPPPPIIGTPTLGITGVALVVGTGSFSVSSSPFSVRQAHKVNQSQITCLEDRTTNVISDTGINDIWDVTDIEIFDV